MQHKQFPVKVKSFSPHLPEIIGTLIKIGHYGRPRRLNRCYVTQNTGRYVYAGFLVVKTTVKTGKSSRVLIVTCLLKLGTQWVKYALGCVYIVCYTAVFSVVTEHSSPQTLLRIEPLSFPAVSQLEFSSHFLEGVRGTLAVR